jgi:hypothetical protein
MVAGRSLVEFHSGRRIRSCLPTGDRSKEILDSLKSWLALDNSVIMAVLLLVIGVKLIGDAI